MRNKPIIFYLLLVAGFVLLHPLLKDIQAKEPDGTHFIKVSGLTAPGVQEQLTIKDIETSGFSDIEIFDPFAKARCQYSGVYLDTFIAHFAKPGVTAVTLKAIDDYEISLSRVDWTTQKIFMVTRLDNHYIDFNQKGPLRIIFPEYDPEKHNSKENLPRWIWMITEIHFK